MNIPYHPRTGRIVGYNYSILTKLNNISLQFLDYNPMLLILIQRRLMSISRPWNDHHQPQLFESDSRLLFLFFQLSGWCCSTNALSSSEKGTSLSVEETLSVLHIANVDTRCSYSRAPLLATFISTDRGSRGIRSFHQISVSLYPTARTMLIRGTPPARRKEAPM